MKKKAVMLSRYFNPIHKGHLKYFNNAKAMDDEIFVILNNDLQRALKGSKEFHGEEERMIIVSNIKAVNQAILSVYEFLIVCATLEEIAKEYGENYVLAFANGGDQNNDTIPERPICEKVGIALIDGLGDKIQSSSWLLKKNIGLSYE
jgi:D-beta-D-heptose 7-phosphate kinase/D-beta-D-heptose 1-phosphate adenosyltransferase